MELDQVVILIHAKDATFKISPEIQNDILSVHLCCGHPFGK